MISSKNKKILFASESKQSIITVFFSSPEHAQGELLGSCDVHRLYTCGRPRRSSVNFLLENTLEGTVLIAST